MKIEAQPRDDHQVKLTVEFEPETYEKYRHQAARKISQESKVPGFRPGKAPFDVVRRIFGDKAISSQAVDLLIDKEYPEIIKQADLNPSGPGSLQNVDDKEALKIEILIPLQPDVDLGDYRSTRVDYEAVAVAPEEIDKFIERLRTSYASVEPAERPIQESDLVYLTVSGQLTSPKEGESPEVIKEGPQQVIVEPEAQQKEDEWPFKGFTHQLIGLSTGDEKTFSHTFPEDAKDEALRGKEVEFHVHIQSVKLMKLPDLTDEFAQTVGEYESIEAMRKMIAQGLEQNAKDQYDQEYFVHVIDKIREKATLKYPPQLLDHEIEHVLDKLQRDLARQKLDFDTYLKIRKLEKDALIEQEVKPAAVQRLERALVMEEIAKAENLQIDQKSLEEAITDTVKEMETTGEYQKARKSLTTTKLADAIAFEAASRVMNQQTLTRLKDIATGAIEQKTLSETPAGETTNAPEAEVTPPDQPQGEKDESVPVTDEAHPDEPQGENTTE